MPVLFRPGVGSRLESPNPGTMLPENAGKREAGQPSACLVAPPNGKEDTPDIPQEHRCFQFRPPTSCLHTCVFLDNSLRVRDQGDRPRRRASSPPGGVPRVPRPSPEPSGKGLGPPGDVPPSPPHGTSKSRLERVEGPSRSWPVWPLPTGARTVEVPTPALRRAGPAVAAAELHRV